MFGCVCEGHVQLKSNKKNCTHISIDLHSPQVALGVLSESRTRAHVRGMASNEIPTHNSWKFFLVGVLNIHNIVHTWLQPSKHAGKYSLRLLC